ncbi:MULTISPECIES: acyl-CoA dehydrogenase [Sphingobacterium]|uniref:acyl-CoA dehydrogenase n=1 Tax=Sphingobacterium TaxID=28453 RepID=UPI0013DABD25|nr:MULTISPECIES: acyl-CoA dehydrogenase [unclassified Sphingobacterium]
MMICENAIQVIRDNQLASIEAKTLVDGQLGLIYENNWFNIWVPTSLGGLELNLQDGLTLLEELAYWDGGMAWTVTLCAGANMFAGYLNKGLTTKIFADPKVCFGGSGRASGRAVWDGEYFTLTGFWRFATGAPHLSHFTLNSFVFDGEEPRLDDLGEQVVFSFLVPRDKVLLHYDWDSFGLVCTASHSFSLDHVAIEPNYAFQIKPEHRTVDTALYRIPFMPFAELTLLVNYLGMYRRYLDLVEKYFFEKSKVESWLSKHGKEYFRNIDTLRLQLESDRNKISLLADLLWRGSKQSTITTTLLEDIACSSRQMVKDIREETTRLFPLLGISAAQNGTELNTIFRNIFTATQHSLLNI